MTLAETCGHCGNAFSSTVPTGWYFQAEKQLGEWQNQHRHDAQKPAQGSNRRSVAVGDAEDVDGTQGRDGVCTCPVVHNGEVVSQTCVPHGPGGINDQFRPTRNRTSSSDDTEAGE